MRIDWMPEVCDVVTINPIKFTDHEKDSINHWSKFRNGQIYRQYKEWILKRLYAAGTYNSNNNDFQLWQQDNYPIELNSNELLDQKLEYIHLNPVAAGFVDQPEAGCTAVHGIMPQPRKDLST